VLTSPLLPQLLDQPVGYSDGRTEHCICSSWELPEVRDSNS
jgi:hypothetical protein